MVLKIAFVPPQPPICMHEKRNDKLNIFSVVPQHVCRQGVCRKVQPGMRCGRSISFPKSD